ncbi:MAG: hypothetical protein EOP84_28645 [Verrucomicrobiaceae bacterium]|nr:MAG: hypothetical protein EOP84_28645 [Verrucomicrobiaceae bacterium]
MVGPGAAQPGLHALVDARPGQFIARPVAGASALVGAAGDAVARVLHGLREREDVHHRLVEKADQARRKTGRGRVEELSKLGITPGRTPTPRFKSAEGIIRGKRGMTPAAKSLADKLRTPRKGW